MTGCECSWDKCHETGKIGQEVFWVRCMAASFVLRSVHEIDSTDSSGINSGF